MTRSIFLAPLQAADDALAAVLRKAHDGVVRDTVFERLSRLGTEMPQNVPPVRMFRK